MKYAFYLIFTSTGMNTSTLSISLFFYHDIYISPKRKSVLGPFPNSILRLRLLKSMLFHEGYDHLPSIRMLLGN